MRILFLCPNYYGIYKIIEKGIQENLECELKTIILNEYKYKNFGQKILNFVSKTFFKKNLKKIWASKDCISSIKPEDTFDYLLIISPDYLRNEELEYVTSKAKKSIVYFWDSFNNIPRYERTLPFFDKHYSFEPKDVKKYNLNFLTNFYYKTEKDLPSEFDTFFIGALDNRITQLLEIVSTLKDKKNKIIVLSKNKSKLKTLENKGLQLITKPKTFEEIQQYFRNSKTIIDIQKKIQNGLTFRVFDAMSHRKKLITTNKDIINYDFYNPNNIFVWDENVKTIPNNFFELPYQELPNAIFEKYSIKNWIETIFDQK